MQHMCEVKTAVKAQVIALRKLQIWCSLVDCTVRTQHLHM